MFNFDLKTLCEQVFFENELELIAEAAEAAMAKLNNLNDFAKEGLIKSIEAKNLSRSERSEIDTSELFDLRDQLKKLLIPTFTQFSKNKTEEDIEKELDDYIKKAIFDPSSVYFKGIKLSPNTDLSGLKYLHREFIGGL